MFIISSDYAKLIWSTTPYHTRIDPSRDCRPRSSPSRTQNIKSCSTGEAPNRVFLGYATMLARRLRMPAYASLHKVFSPSFSSTHFRLNFRSAASNLFLVDLECVAILHLQLFVELALSSNPVTHPISHSREYLPPRAYRWAARACPRTGSARC